MNKYNLGDTYRKGRIAPCDDDVPKFAAFKTLPDEIHIFEPVKDEGDDSVITGFDKTIMAIIGTFSACFVTSRVIKELLLLMGVQFSANVIERALKRLHKNRLISFSRFGRPDREPAHIRIISLTQKGSDFVTEQLGLRHRFNLADTKYAEVYKVKARAETAHLITNYLKNLPVESFEVRPVIVVDPARGAILRPAASLTLGGEKICVEVPRRREGWLEDLADKLCRYKLVFSPDSMPAIIINGEDEAMNCEIASMVKENGITAEILYTDDLAMYGERFRQSLYMFDENGAKISLNFTFEEAG